jgi:hypothetical protein
MEIFFLTWQVDVAGIDEVVDGWMSGWIVVVVVVVHASDRDVRWPLGVFSEVDVVLLKYSDVAN